MLGCCQRSRQRAPARWRAAANRPSPPVATRSRSSLGPEEPDAPLARGAHPARGRGGGGSGSRFSRSRPRRIDDHGLRSRCSTLASVPRPGAERTDVPPAWPTALLSAPIRLIYLDLNQWITL